MPKGWSDGESQRNVIRAGYFAVQRSALVRPFSHPLPAAQIATNWPLLLSEQAPEPGPASSLTI